ncbi:MFS transporter [Kutzneria buriramensis]|uniref:MFS transporter n=1 Tax=Kutzneria buriramensis TaxID=1045776 RepID=A0A3E0H7M7_9PSEU|nr:MFS transporter [Kutzneria buriramensis]REH39277.1 MFS transporter [Kutzneria buriramensis]
MLLWGRGVSALGDGLWFTVWAVFFTRVLGLSSITVGLGMAVAAGVGMAAAVPIGSLADRVGPRRVLVAVTAVRAIAMASYLLVHSTVVVMAVTIAFTALASGGTAVRSALITGLVTDNAVRLRVFAQQRVAQHVGYAVGAGIGALVLAADRPTGYLMAVAGNALTFVVLAAATLAVPKPEGRPAAGSRAALRDRPYLAIVGFTALLSLCWAMLSTGLPLWISGSTRLPLALSGVVVVISSVGIAALQVSATRLARTVRQASRTAVRAGSALAASCVLLATTSGAAGFLGTATVIVAALLHVCGELGYVAANWGLSVNLMREDARGAYQGANEAATATVQMFAPAVFTTALGVAGAGGWLLVAALFVLAVAPVPALGRWAERARPPERAVWISGRSGTPRT